MYLLSSIFLKILYIIDKILLKLVLKVQFNKYLLSLYMKKDLSYVRGYKDM